MHRIYVGKIVSGILYFFTVGFLFIGTIVDLIKIVINQFTDSVGYPLEEKIQKSGNQSTYLINKKMKLIISGLFVLVVCIGIISGISIRQHKDVQAEKNISKEKVVEKSNYVEESLDKIKTNIEIDEGVFKDGKQKFIVTVKNTSDYLFIGNVTVSAKGVSILDIPIIELNLQPGESKSSFSFGEVSSNTKFRYNIKGHFEKLEFQHNPKLNYTIVKRNVGQGYATIFIYTESSEDDNIIAIAKEFKNNYEDRFSIGYQLRFTHTKENPQNEDTFATYARTHTSKLDISTVITYVGGERVLKEYL